MERLEIGLDGVPLDPARTTLDLDGTPLPVPQLTAQDERWWSVLDSATVRVELDELPSPGPHAIDPVIGTRIPYLVSPTGAVAVIADRARAVVTR